MGALEINIGRRVAGLALLALIALAGCTTRVTFVRIREPLEKDRIRNVKVVAVMPFRNRSSDSGAASMVQSAVRAGVQDSFTVVERHDLQKLAMERALHESDLVNADTRKKLRLTGADTAIVGVVSKHRYRERRGYENVEVPMPEQVVTWRNGRKITSTVIRMRIVRKPYLRVTVTASFAMHVIDLSNGTTLVSHAMTLTATEQGGGLSSKSIRNMRGGSAMLNELSGQIIGGFLAKIVKTKVVEHRRLKKYWGDGVEAAENGDWEIASHYFWAKYWRDKDSPKTMNNIAVCIEATADNDPAKLRWAIDLYEKALERDYDDLYSTNLRRARRVLDDALRSAPSGQRPR